MFKVAHITDLHIGKPGEIYLGLDSRQRLLTVLKDAQKQQPDLYVFGGDYSRMEPDPDACQWLKDQLDQLAAPYILLAGNHDKTDQLAQIFSLPLRNGFLEQKLQTANHQHIFMDSSKSCLSEEQLDWLKASMETPLPIVLWIHHPPCTISSAFMDIKHSLKDWPALMDLLKSHKNRVSVFCGHYHANLRLQQGNVNVHVCPPSSFFISHSTTVFEQDDYPPAYQLVLFGHDRELVIPRYVGNIEAV